MLDSSDRIDDRRFLAMGLSSAAMLKVAQEMSEAVGLEVSVL